MKAKGFFTRELEEELLAGTIDIAVHSHKDLPTDSPHGLIIAAVSERENPAELLLILKKSVDVHQKLSVKYGGNVGTSSNRRRAQLLSYRPDLKVQDLRGNVPTRINKLRDGNYDAIMLAKAGVSRLSLDVSEFHIEQLTPVEFVPAPAQGALAIQIRESDKKLFDALQPLNHQNVAEELAVERKVLKLFGGGCHLPLGCYCRRDKKTYQVFTSKANDENDFPDRLFIEAASADGLPEKIVSYFSRDRKFPKKIFISRDLAAQSYFRRALEKHGIEIEARSLIRALPVITTLNDYILKDIDWIFFSSKNAVEYFFQLGPKLPVAVKFGVMGGGSEDMLRQQGFFVDFIGESIDPKNVASEFAKIADGKTILFPAAENSLRSVQQGLSSETKIIDLPVYQTVPLKNIVGSDAEILVFTSPSNAEVYFTEHLWERDQKVIAIGKSTGKKLDELAVEYTLPYTPDETGLAEAVFGT